MPQYHHFLDEVAGKVWKFETLLMKPNVGESVILDDIEHVIYKIVHENQKAHDRERKVKYYVNRA